MKPRKSQLILSCLAVLVMVLGLPGCVDNAKSLVIVAAVPYFAGEGPEDCDKTITCGLPKNSVDEITYQPEGQLDLNYPGFGGQPEYELYIQIHNNMLNTADEDNGIVDSHTVLLSRFEVRYHWLQGRELLEDPVAFPAGQGLLLLEEQKIISPTSGRVGSAADIYTPGLSTGLVQAIPPSLVGSNLVNIGESFVDSLVLGVKIRAIGTTTGGDRVETPDFVFPIYFCWGCHSCPAGYCYFACKPGQDDEYFCAPPATE